jgi:hypothetical protein
VTRSGDLITISTPQPTAPGLQRIDNYDGSILVDPPTGPAVTVHVREGGVQTHHLRDMSVQTEKLANKSVTRAKVADQAIATPQLSGDGATIDGQVLMYDAERDAVIWSNYFRGYFDGDGHMLRYLDAGQIDRGTLGDDRLSENIPRLDANNHFTGSVNRFKMLQGKSVEIAGDKEGLGMRINSGRSVLAYGVVEDGDTIPMNVSVVMIKSNDQWGTSDVRLPESAENGQVVVAVCDDPGWCRVKGILIEDTDERYSMTGAEMKSEFFWEPSELISQGQGVLFVKTEAGWVPVE